MTQTIGQIIKTLRKERGFTQDDLADKLNVSPQAVSRWENEISMPDILQIVPLAALFEVSTDVLFGLNTMGADAAIDKVRKDADKPDVSNDKCITLWSDLLKTYPRNNVIRSELANAYCCRKGNGDFYAAAELYEKILDESTDQALRFQALNGLCFCYKRVGDITNAVRVAKLCATNYVTVDRMLADIDGYEGQTEVNQKVLSDCIQEAAWCIMRCDYKTNKDAIFAYNTALAMLDLLYMV